MSGANRHADWSAVGVEITLRDISSKGNSLIADVIAQTENTVLYDWVSYLFVFGILFFLLLLLLISILAT